MTARRERFRLDPTRSRAARARTLRRKAERTAKLQVRGFSVAVVR